MTVNRSDWFARLASSVGYAMIAVGLAATAVVYTAFPY